jgi:hypothetical protein
VREIVEESDAMPEHRRLRDWRKRLLLAYGRLHQSGHVVWRFLHFDETRTHRVKENIGILDCVLTFFLSLFLGLGGALFVFHFGILAIFPFVAGITYVLLLTLNKVVDVKA